jgi:toxin ParE1/3/4
MTPSRQRAVRLTPRAIDELRRAASWYNRQRPDLGLQFLDAFDATLSDIRSRSASFGLISAEVHRALLDRFPYGVFFAIEDDVILVLAILHNRRDPRRWPSRPAR